MVQDLPQKCRFIQFIPLLKYTLTVARFVKASQPQLDIPQHKWNFACFLHVKNACEKIWSRMVPVEIGHTPPCQKGSAFLRSKCHRIRHFLGERSCDSSGFRGWLPVTLDWFTRGWKVPWSTCGFSRSIPLELNKYQDVYHSSHIFFGYSTQCWK